VHSNYGKRPICEHRNDAIANGVEMTAPSAGVTIMVCAHTGWTASAKVVPNAAVPNRAVRRETLSSKEMQKFVGVNEPQAGVMLESTLQRTPAKLRAMDYVHLIVEFEIAVQMAADLPAADAPYSRGSVAPFVQAVMPAIEIADDRNADYTQLARHPFELIADNGWNEGAVLGMPVTK